MKRNKTENVRPKVSRVQRGDAGGGQEDEGAVDDRR